MSNIINVRDREFEYTKIHYLPIYGWKGTINNFDHSLEKKKTAKTEHI